MSYDFRKFSVQEASQISDSAFFAACALSDAARKGSIPSTIASLMALRAFSCYGKEPLLPKVLKTPPTRPLSITKDDPTHQAVLLYPYLVESPVLEMKPLFLPVQGNTLLDRMTSEFQDISRSLGVSEIDKILLDKKDFGLVEFTYDFLLQSLLPDHVYVGAKNLVSFSYLQEVLSETELDLYLAWSRLQNKKSIFYKKDLAKEAGIRSTDLTKVVRSLKKKGVVKFDGTYYTATPRLRVSTWSGKDIQADEVSSPPVPEEMSIPLQDVPEPYEPSVDTNRPQEALEYMLVNSIKSLLSSKESVLVLDTKNRQIIIEF